MFHPPACARVHRYLDSDTLFSALTAMHGKVNQEVFATWWDTTGSQATGGTLPPQFQDRLSQAVSKYQALDPMRIGSITESSIPTLYSELRDSGFSESLPEDPEDWLSAVGIGTSHPGPSSDARAHPHPFPVPRGGHQGARQPPFGAPATLAARVLTGTLLRHRTLPHPLCFSLGSTGERVVPFNSFVSWLIKKGGPEARPASTSEDCAVVRLDREGATSVHGSCHHGALAEHAHCENCSVV